MRIRAQSKATSIDLIYTTASTIFRLQIYRSASSAFLLSSAFEAFQRSSIQKRPLLSISGVSASLLASSSFQKASPGVCSIHGKISWHPALHTQPSITITSITITITITSSTLISKKCFDQSIENTQIPLPYLSTPSCFCHHVSA